MLQDDVICGAVTANVVSWRERSQTPANPPPPRRYVFGQRVGDEKLYPSSCNVDFNAKCRVTAQSSDGVAPFTWMHFGGGAADVILVNYTTGFDLSLNPNP